MISWIDDYFSPLVKLLNYEFYNDISSAITGYLEPPTMSIDGGLGEDDIDGEIIVAKYSCEVNKYDIFETGLGTIGIFFNSKWSQIVDMLGKPVPHDSTLPKLIRGCKYLIKLHYVSVKILSTKKTKGLGVLRNVTDDDVTFLPYI